MPNPLVEIVDRSYNFGMGRTSTARQRLVESGKSLMAARGYASVGVAELCDHAGVQKGSFYYFFPAKSDLAVAVIDSFWQDFEASLTKALDSPGSPVDRIEAFLDRIHVRHRDTCVDTGSVRGCLLGNMALELSATDDKVRDRLVLTFAKFEEHLAETVAEAMENGELPNGDPHLLAGELVAYVEGMILLAKANNDAAVIERLRGGALALLGYARKERGNRVRN